MALGWRKQYVRYKDYFLDIVLVYTKRPEIRMFLEILLSLITISFFAIFALRPTLITIASLLKDIEAKEDVIKKMDTKIANLKSAQELYRRETDTIPLIESAVPLVPTPETLMYQFENLAAINSVSLDSVSIGEAKLAGEVKPQAVSEDFEPLPQNSIGLEYSVRVSGSFDALKNFVASLENLRRPAKVDSTSIVAGLESETLTVVVNGRVPFYHQGG